MLSYTCTFLIFYTYMDIMVQRIWLFLDIEEYRPFDGCKIEI